MPRSSPGRPVPLGDAVSHFQAGRRPHAAGRLGHGRSPGGRPVPSLDSLAADEEVRRRRARPPGRAATARRHAAGLAADGRPKLPRAGEHLDRLLSSTSGSMRLLARGRPASGCIRQSRRRRSKRPPPIRIPVVRDLFERFVPEEKRTPRLGTSINAAHLLALRGQRRAGPRALLQCVGRQLPDAATRSAARGATSAPT